MKTMLIKIRFIDTGIAIEEAVDKHDSDKEVEELLHLLVLSFFCLESDYIFSSINRKIQKKLKLLDVDEGVLEDIYDVLYTETKLIFRNTFHIQINIVSPYHAYEKPIQTRSLST